MAKMLSAHAGNKATAICRENVARIAKTTITARSATYSSTEMYSVREIQLMKQSDSKRHRPSNSKGS